MEKKEILEQLTAIFEKEESILKDWKTFKTLNAEFSQIAAAEDRIKEEHQLNIDLEVVIEKEEEELTQQLKVLVAKLEARFSKEKTDKPSEEKENLSKKEVILKRFQIMLQEEENIGKLFNKIKEIREEWKEIGNIPQQKFQDIQNRYSQLNELFNYNVNIYKELKENDLKKNYSLKNQIIAQVKELLEEKQIKTVEKKIRELQNEWEEVGPTFTEHWEKLKEEYWSTVKSIYERIKEHYVKLDEQKEANYETKKTLVEKAKEIASQVPDSHQMWATATAALSKIQDEWKKVGYAPKAVNDEIWKEFRIQFDKFYDEKATFYKSRNEEFSGKKELKEKLIEKAAKLVEFTNFKEGTQMAIKLQKEWKEIGHAGGHVEQRLWKDFRAKCDAFFDKKDNFYKEQDQANEANLTKKKELIAEIKAFEKGENTTDTVAQLKEFSKRFAEIGNVPFKEKDTIYEAYKEALDAHYDGLKMSKLEKEKVIFQAKIDMIKGSKNPLSAINKEKDFIRKRITAITKEVTNFENNLGFFGNSKGAEALLKGVRDKIQKGRDEIEILKRKMKDLTKAAEPKEEPAKEDSK